MARPRKLGDSKVIILKPDAFDRALVGTILARFECKDTRSQRPSHQLIRRSYTGRFTPIHCREHYADHIGKPFFGGLFNQMISGISMFLDLDMPWDEAREIAMLLRSNYGTEGPRNLIHASDSQDANIRETVYWFKGYPDDCPVKRQYVLP